LKDAGSNATYSGGPISSGEASDRVLRGGSWFAAAKFCRSVCRNWWWLVVRNGGFGFRVFLVRGPAAEGGAREQKGKKKAKAPRETGVIDRETRSETNDAGGAGSGVDGDGATASLSRIAGSQKNALHGPTALPISWSPDFTPLRSPRQTGLG
jgi:hypothetical protein